jgi:fructosamine-3-kinase
MELRSFESIKLAIEGCFGRDVSVAKETYVSGGDINEAVCLWLSNGEKVFVKINSLDSKGFFEAEAEGLSAIASTHTIATPALLCKGTDREKNISFLMMEMIERGKKIPDYWETFGTELANMHLYDTSAFLADEKYGFSSDNYIGATKQINAPKDKWIVFFLECRLEPQFKMAERYFDNSLIRKITDFLDNAEKILTEPKKPSLLHGDLWSGNFITDKNGKAMLIDPAAYIGHAEADLAMTELFGQLPDSFYLSYRSVYPLQAGYEVRKEIYNLYHLLNHLNLFGISYLPSVIDIIRRYS